MHRILQLSTAIFEIDPFVEEMDRADSTINHERKSGVQQEMFLFVIKTVDKDQRLAAYDKLPLFLRGCRKKPTRFTIVPRRWLDFKLQNPVLYSKTN